MDAIIVYRKILMQLLNEGFNPFEDNTDYLQLIEKHIKNQLESPIFSSP